MTEKAISAIAGTGVFQEGNKVRLLSDILTPVKVHFDMYPFEAGQSTLISAAVGIVTFCMLEVAFMNKHI